MNGRVGGGTGEEVRGVSIRVETQRVHIRYRGSSGAERRD